MAARDANSLKTGLSRGPKHLTSLAASWTVFSAVVAHGAAELSAEEGAQVGQGTEAGLADDVPDSQLCLAKHGADGIQSARLYFIVDGAVEDLPEANFQKAA